MNYLYSLPELEPYKHYLIWSNPVSAMSFSVLRQTWVNPDVVVPILTLIGPVVIQTALAQLTGPPFAPITFSFGWVAYAFGNISLAMSDGRFMPPPSESIVINGKTGYMRNNHSWILSRILSDFHYWKPKKVDDIMRTLLDDATRSDREKAEKNDEPPPPPRRVAGLCVSVFHPSSRWEPGRPVADWIYYSGIPVAVLQLGISVVPGALRGQWVVFVITASGTLLALATAALPQWKTEKWACRRKEKTVILTPGNGAQHALVIVGHQNFFDLEELAAARPERSHFTLACTIVLAILWIVHLIVALGNRIDPWYIVAIGGIGMLHNVLVAGHPRRPEALGLPLEFEKCIAHCKTMETLMAVELLYAGVGRAMLDTFFPRGLRKEEEEWWNEAARRAYSLDPTQTVVPSAQTGRCRMVAPQQLHGVPVHNRPDALAGLMNFSDIIRAGGRVDTQNPGPTKRRARTPPPRALSQPLSAFSTSPSIPNSGWSSPNFALGAGMIIIQPATDRIVVLHSASDPEGPWFFPRGRKDLGESLPQAALREAREESGYRPELFPVYHLTRQPPPTDDPSARGQLNTEPVYVTTTFWERTGAEYLTFWYIGRIGEEVQAEKKLSSTESDYTTHLLTYQEALTKVWGQQKAVLEYAWAVYIYTLKVAADQRTLELMSILPFEI